MPMDKRESRSMASTGSATSTTRMIPASAGAAPQRPNLNRNNRRSLYHPPSAAGGNGPPEVYWSEGGATPSATQQDTFTFYRDPTPEPEERRGEKRGVGVGVHAGDDGELSDLGERRICGLRRVWFWGIVALALMAVVAIAVGVGVGVGLSTPSAEVSEQTSSGTPESSSGANGGGTSKTDGATSLTTPTPTSSGSDTENSSQTSTQSGPTATDIDSAFPTETSSGSLTCPESNYTLYAVPGSPIRFLRLCDVDVTSDHATDIRSVRTESMAECMRNCAGTFGCQGAGWGPQRGDLGSEFWCWMKGELTDVFTDLRGWEFAIMQ